MLRDTKPTSISLDGQAADDKRVAAVYRCRLAVADLQETDHPDIKFCEQCKQKVFKVVDFDGFEKAVASKGCVWGPAQFQPVGSADMFLGGPLLDSYTYARSTLKWDE